MFVDRAHSGHYVWRSPRRHTAGLLHVHISTAEKVLNVCSCPSYSSPLHLRQFYCSLHSGLHTLLSLSLNRFKKDSKQNVIYKPAAKDIDQTSVTVT